MKLQVAVFFGGNSTEHEISVISAIQAIGYLDREKYDVYPVYITKNNEMYTGKDMDKIESYKDIPALLKKSSRVCLKIYENKTVLEKTEGLFNKTVAAIDVAFPIVHGTNVEDGTIQGFLRMYNLPVVGCDLTSSAVGMDKYVMKAVLAYNNIPVLDCERITADRFSESPDVIMEVLEDRFGYPMIVKPVNLGSSIGISKATDRDSLEEALELGFRFAEKVLVERAIENLKEINCAVLGDYTDAVASVCEQPLNGHEILSYKDKYMSGGAKTGSKTGGESGGSKGMASLSRKIPADISDELTTKIQEIAVDAFVCLGCSGVSRIDFMIDMDTNELYLNEINTIPGSLSFYLWEPVGTPYTKLLDKMIQIALNKEKRESNLTYSFETNVLQNANIGGSKGSKLK